MTSRAPTTLFVVVVLALCGFAAGCGGVRLEPAPRGIPLPLAEAPRPLHERDVVRLFRSPTGAFLATVDASALHLWALPEMVHAATIRGFDGRSTVDDVRIAEDGGAVAIAMDHGEIFVWDRDRDEALPLLPRWSHVVYKLVGFWGDDLVWVRTDGQLMSWLLGPGGAYSGETRHGYVGRVDHATPTGDGLLLWGSRVVWLAPDEAGAIEPVTLTALAGGRLPHAPFVGDSLEQVFSQDDGALLVYETRSGELTTVTPAQVRASSGPEDRIVATSSSPDGRWAVVGWRSGGLELWDVARRALLRAEVLGEPFVRDVRPQKILDVALGDDFLWVLLPEQVLLRYDISTGERRSFEL